MTLHSYLTDRLIALDFGYINWLHESKLNYLGNQPFYVAIMNLGYARVRTEDQSLDVQLDALKKAGCRKIYSEQIKGSTTNRPGVA